MVSSPHTRSAETAGPTSTSQKFLKPCGVRVGRGRSRGRGAARTSSAVRASRGGEWKSPRARPSLAENLEDDVNDISRIALAAPERLQHRLLGLLRGVDDLTVWAPDRHTVLDSALLKRGMKSTDAAHSHRRRQRTPTATCPTTSAT